jgi:hypothetical protein
VTATALAPRTAIRIQPYTAEWEPAVASFNARLAAAGVPAGFRFPERSTPLWLPRRDGRRIYQEYYLATQGDEVRGACILKHQDFWVAGRMQPVAFYHLPISEGLVDRAYAGVGVQMLRSAARAAPLLFCLGMGGFDRPLPQMLKAMRWHLRAVPFLFRVNRPARFLRQIAPLRSTRLRRAAADAAARSGLGWLGISAIQRLRTRAGDPGVRSATADSFGSWTDDVWERCRTEYRLIGSRDAATLSVLYPSSEGFHTIAVSRNGVAFGWAIVRDTQMRGSRYFGDLRVGSIVDCLAATRDAPAVIRMAAAFLQDRGVDVVVSNQAHPAWVEALAGNGFLHGPSNFVFAASPALAQLVTPLDGARAALHLNRGDGDGPVNL